MSENRKSVSICGFLNVLKPPGMTSSQVVGFVRRLLGGEKVGHAGTLDPEAAGVLPLMVGKAARLFDYIQEKEKAYVTEIAFGCATNTQDAQGIPTQWAEHYPDEVELREVLKGFVGEIWQRPPMYSAIKQDGKRLYELAREGKHADIPERRVTLHSLSLTRMTEPHGAMLSVQCSKGFYVRTLCHDIGARLGCPAHMRFLLRTCSGVFALDTAQTLEALERAWASGRLHELFLPPEMALTHLPRADVKPWVQREFCHGGRLPWAAFPDLHHTAAQDGVPACLWLKGKLTAVGVRQKDEIKLRTWLGDTGI